MSTVPRYRLETPGTCPFLCGYPLKDLQAASTFQNSPEIQELPETQEPDAELSFSQIIVSVKDDILHLDETLLMKVTNKTTVSDVLICFMNSVGPLPEGGNISFFYDDILLDMCDMIFDLAGAQKDSKFVVRFFPGHPQCVTMAMAVGPNLTDEIVSFYPNQTGLYLKRALIVRNKLPLLPNGNIVTDPNALTLIYCGSEILDTDALDNLRFGWDPHHMVTPSVVVHIQNTLIKQ